MDEHDAFFQSPTRILRERGLRARKRFGQNFLVDPRFAARVAEAIPKGSFVVEIGGGTGSLTAALAERARATIVLEIDRDLAAILNERFDRAAKNIAIQCGNALDFDFYAALVREDSPRAICGNLPYNITTPLVEKIVSSSDVWESAVLMVQREYAKRLVARPGTPDYGSLTVFVGYYCSAEKLFDVGAAGFYPAPSVASAVVRLSPRANRAEGVNDEALLLRAIRAAFAQRRKTLSNCLASRAPGRSRAEVDLAIRTAGLDPGIRGERLSLADFRSLANSLSESNIEIS